MAIVIALMFGLMVVIISVLGSANNNVVSSGSLIIASAIFLSALLISHEISEASKKK